MIKSPTDTEAIIEQMRESFNQGDQKPSMPQATRIKHLVYIRAKCPTLASVFRRLSELPRAEAGSATKDKERTGWMMDTGALHAHGKG